MTYQRGVYRNELIQHFRQELEVESVGAIGQRLCRVVVDFNEDAVHSRRHGGARQQRNELGLAAALRAAAVAVCRASRR